jgi:ADP-ribosylglycohydrolase
VEFKSAEEIRERHGFVHSIGNGASYTDDTEMTLALAESLLECKGIDAEHCSKNYVKFRWD